MMGYLRRGNILLLFVRGLRPPLTLAKHHHMTSSSKKGGAESRAGSYRHVAQHQHQHLLQSAHHAPTCALRTSSQHQLSTSSAPAATSAVAGAQLVELVRPVEPRVPTGRAALEVLPHLEVRR